MLATATIEPTASNPSREVMLVQIASGRAVMTVARIEGKKNPRRVAERYDVREVPCLGVPGRAFEVAKSGCVGGTETVAGQHRAERVGSGYFVRLWANGSTTCTCAAGSVGRAACIHTLALKQLEEQGELKL